MATGWSGQLDFLINKKTGKSEFYNVEYDLHPIPEHVVWDGVIIKDSMWANPREHSAKQKMRECYSDLISDNNLLEINPDLSGLSAFWFKLFVEIGWIFPFFKLKTSAVFIANENLLRYSLPET